MGVKVSIIVPTFNVEEYLVECMDSIIKQTLQEIEIICINDGSTDGSLAILQRYAADDSRIIIVDKENGGYGMAMNIGLDKATGEYIGIVEPDDFVSVNMYKELYDVAKENDLDFVKADFYRFMREDTGDMRLLYNHLDATGEDYNQVFNPSQTPLAIKYIMNTWSGIYRKTFLDKNQIRHNETPGASFQDNGFFFKTFVCAQRAMILDKPYYMNRRDNPNSSVHNPDKVYCMNVEYEYIRDFLMQDRERWERFKYIYNFKKYGNYIFTLGRIAKHYRQEYVSRINVELKTAMEQGEIELDLFTIYEQGRLILLIKKPKVFYQRYGVLDVEERRDKAIIDMITFKVSEFIMVIPRGMKKYLKKTLG